MVAKQKESASGIMSKQMRNGDTTAKLKETAPHAKHFAIQMRIVVILNAMLVTAHGGRWGSAPKQLMIQAQLPPAGNVRSWMYTNTASKNKQLLFKSTKFNAKSVKK